MKIGTITYHYSLNYGAALQCYALKEYLSKDNEVHVINYEDDNQFRNASMYNHGTGIKRIVYNTLFLPFHSVRMRKKIRYEIFANKHFSLTERVENADELKTLIERDKYDCVIVGSDQVWNPNIKDFTVSYFLPFSTNAAKVAYAASFGDANLDELENYQTYISDFNLISIREIGSYEKIAALARKKVSVVPDPVFLLERREWDKLYSSGKRADEDSAYLICYFMNKRYANQYYDLTKKIAKERNLKIIRLNPFFSSKSLLPNSNLDAGPIEFLRLMEGASFICTDSFHGTAFSIIFEKEFAAFDFANGNDTRKKDLLRRVGLESRLINDDSMLQNINKRIDLEIVARELQGLRNEGITFLQEAITLCNKEM